MILSFKQFTNRYTSIFEELTPSQKKEVDSWEQATPETKSHTDHYFGQGNDVKEYNLEGTQNKSEVHRAVEQHLGREISPDEYKQGTAKDKYGRSVKIGGLLGKSKAPSQLVNDFANDSTRQGKKYTGLSVKVSRHPHDVAGQTSGGQSWEQESCKNFEDGCNRGYLKHEVKHGTVVGYLKDHTGKEIARTTLQPYKNDKGHVMYAVDSHYGINHQGFRDHMEQVAKQLSGEHKGGNITYKVDPNVYNDSGIESVIHPKASKEDIGHLVRHQDPSVRQEVARNTNLHPEHQATLAKDSDWGVRRALARNPNLHPEHQATLAKDSDWGVRQGVRQALARNPNLHPEHQAILAKDSNRNVRLDLASNLNLHPEHQATLAKDSDWGVRMALAGNRNLHPKHQAALAKDSDEDVRKTLADNPNLRPEHQATLAKDSSEHVRRVLADTFGK